MRKAIASFEREFVQWGITLPARDVVERQPGHLDRHGWSIDYSFGSDAFGEYLEYHARRVAAGEPAIERHTRVYHNGERNFIPAPEMPGENGDAALSDASAAAAPAAVAAQMTPAATPAEEAAHHHPTLPPWEVIMEEATGESRGRASRSPLREKVRAIAAGRFSSAVGGRGTPRMAARDRGPVFEPEPESLSNALERKRRTIISVAIGMLGALLLATVLVVAVRSIRGRNPGGAPLAARDGASLPPVVVRAPEILGFSTDSAASRFTQPLVGAPRDPSRAEIVRPEHGMTPIIPTDPRTKRKNRPAPTTRGEKFHVP